MDITRNHDEWIAGITKPRLPIHSLRRGDAVVWAKSKSLLHLSRLVSAYTYLLILTVSPLICPLPY